ncbi:MAG: hypothetical protein QOH48_1861 [Actinomycetota bacterium]|jgi:hypothetical protein|nr:hypothetical protein [Actinomycetota bacterium]
MTVDSGRLDALYAAPLEEFTAQRNRVAKELTAGGDKDGAAEVRALQKPNTTAWTLNQLTRSDPDAVDELLATANKLRRVQQGEAGDLRALHAQVRNQVAKLLARAQAVLEEGNKQATQSVKNRLTQSLMAAASDDQAGATLREGRLARELEPGGFAPTGDLFVSFPPESKSSQRADEARERASTLLEEAETARAEAQELEDEANRAEKAAVRARAKAEGARASAEALQARAEAARDASETR